MALGHQPRFGFEQVLNMGSPAIEGLSTFHQKLVTLVHGSDPRNGSTLVVQHFVGNVRGNAEPSHPGDACATKIVKSPG